MLSYGPWGLTPKIWVGLVGLVLPFSLSFSWLGSYSLKTKFPFGKSPFQIPSWAWLAVMAISLLARLIPLLNSYWPTPDDGVGTFIPIQLSKEWTRQFFFTTSQSPPAYYWLSSLYFKWIQPSILSARLFQLVLSLISVAIFGAACRRIFSTAFSFIALVFFSTGFWPLFCSRFFLPPNLVLLWEILAFAALAFFLKADSKSKKGFNAFILGLTTGLGFWVAIPWLLVPLMIVPLFLIKLKNHQPAERLFLLGRFGTPFFLTAIPFFLVFFHQEMGGHMRILMGYETHATPLQRAKDLLSNWTCLFWLGHAKEVNEGYTPFWGGMMNPIEGALCFIGLPALMERNFSPFGRWLGAALLVFVLPGLLTNAYQIFHDLLVLPFLYLLCALGVQALLAQAPDKNRPWLLTGILVFSIPLSLTQLIKSYDPSPTPQSRAFEILNRVRSQKGPGLIFLDLRTDVGDHSLNLAVYPFNTAENSERDPMKAGWAAVICNANYKYFLSKRFSDASWYWLGPDGFWNQGGLLLAVIPTEENRREVFQDWLEVNRRFHSIDAKYYSSPFPLITDDLFHQFLMNEEKTEVDPFLESVFCEKAVFYQKDKVPATRLLPWITKAIGKGYPAPHLLVAEALLLEGLGHSREARVALRKAVHSPMDLTSASQLLRLLEAQP